jgi:hypothetical protein
VFAKKPIASLFRHASVIGRVVIPFLFLLFFCPEPVHPDVDDFLPAASSRLAAIKSVKSLSPEKGEKATTGRMTLAIGGVAFTATFQRIFVLVSGSQSFQVFYFIGNRLVRAPPRRVSLN